MGKCKIGLTATSSSTTSPSAVVHNRPIRRAIRSDTIVLIPSLGRTSDPLGRASAPNAVLWNSWRATNRGHQGASASRTWEREEKLWSNGYNFFIVQFQIWGYHHHHHKYFPPMVATHSKGSQISHQNTGSKFFSVQMQGNDLPCFE